MFSTDDPETKKNKPREKKIAHGKKIIEQIKYKNLREIRNDKEFLGKQTKDVQFALANILDRIKKEKIDVYTGDITVIEEIVEQEKEAFKNKKIQQFFEERGATIPVEEREGLEAKILKKLEAGIELDEIEEQYVDYLNRTNSEKNKIEEFATKMLRVRTNVVYELTSKMREYFINNLLEESKNSDTPKFSDDVFEEFFRAKKLNYREFVQFTNWDYQTIQLPKATLELVEQCAESLVRSGAIRDKFYGETVEEYLKDENALKYMKTKFRPESEYESYKKEHQIGVIRSHAKTIDGRLTRTEGNIYLDKLFNDLSEYVQNEDEVFAMRYQDTFNAIPVRIRRKLDLALEPRLEEPIDEKADSDSLQKTKEHFQKHLYHNELKKQIYTIREELAQEYGTLNLTEEQKAEYVNKHVGEELKDMELKIARQLAKEYLAGMTDRSFIDLAIKTGYLSPDVITNAKRGEILSDNVKKLSRAIQKQEDEGR